MNTKLFMILALAAVLSTAGCKVQQFGSTQYGLEVVHLPSALGGGIKPEPILPGTLKFYMPWTVIYPVDTQVQAYSFAMKGRGDDPNANDAINTRAADGNEVHLELTVQYHIDPQQIKTVLMQVGESNENAAEAVMCWSRAHIRTYMGLLRTEDFYSNGPRYKQCDEAKAALNRDLNKFGIIVDRVIPDQHTFAAEYQQLIDEAKQAEQQAQAKMNEVKTKEADWLMQYQTAQGQYNQVVAEAEGKKRQKIASADAYFEARKNEAEAIRISGEKEVEGIQKQIEALQQAGGENIVRLEYGKSLLESQARFWILPGSDASQNMNFNTTNYNQLLKDLGMVSLSQQAQQPPQQQQPQQQQQQPQQPTAPAKK